MDIVRSWRDTPPALKGAVLAIGNFDGVHRGHQEVLRELVEHGERAGLPTVVVTFHPHPLKGVRPEAAPPLLTSTPERKLLLASSGVRYAVFLEFTRELQQYAARRFVVEILIGRLGMRELVIGHDHGFGRGRSGDADTLRGTRPGATAPSATKIWQARGASGRPLSERWVLIRRKARKLTYASGKAALRACLTRTSRMTCRSSPNTTTRATPGA